MAAVLFDIDGTLVDSNYLHAHAWYRAFLQAGVKVDAWRIHRSIGMDGASLVASLTGHSDDAAAKTAKSLHADYYKECGDMLLPFPGARDILEKIERRGLSVVLATSAPEDELALLRRTLKRDDVVSAITSGEDVETAKPEPHIINIALERAGVRPNEAIFVGDTVWDIEACRRANVDCIAVLTGGISRAELEAAGAVAVYESVGELSADLENSPIAALMR
ncbi:HAD family hydrolase [Hoyosella sp. YIM 151337]|uniref:HAD family hydrolase n=1 Tax=Hoyosella sp. YIM 151337 TaxID=2992742 RepID=UPI0022363083|nr:HAD family hydrolase [Hoyosella sp. YIM 151337]MCW4355536.1 HAD family hydrolase [Hoyosella sp. YIM 151337]